MTVTVPDEVAPGQDFSVTGTTLELHIPPPAQRIAVVFDADAIQGVIRDLEVNLANGSVNFQPTAAGQMTQTSPTQFNAVAAVQPPNQPPTGNPRINGGDTTRGGFQPATPPETFSFGDIPLDTTASSGTVYGPAPGVGGGFSPGSGSPDVLPDIGPIVVTGAMGENVVIQSRNPGGPDVAGIPAGNPRILSTSVSFHQPDGTYGDTLPTDCAYDTSPPGTGAGNSVPKPDPTWVDQIVIPIDGEDLDGRGATSARGTDVDASLGTGTVSAQFSAITSCDEAQSTRPFIVRWTEGATTHTFTKTTIDISTCNTDGSNVNAGTGTGTVDGSTPATLEWSFQDSPDAVQIEVIPEGGETLTIEAAPPAALNGRPGGVWVFGELPWPAGG